MDIRNPSASAEDGLDKASFLGLLDALIEKLPDTLISLVVLLDEFVGFGGADAQAAGQAEGGLAVDDAEINGLGLAALVRADMVQIDAEDLAGYEAMDVLVVGEGLAELFVFAEMGQYAPFNMGVIGPE